MEKKIVKRMGTIFDIKTKQNQMKKGWNWKISKKESKTMKDQSKERGL
jgi:hypothetical protein